MSRIEPKTNINIYQNDSEKKSHSLLSENLDSSYTIVYEPSIGLQSKQTPDFIILSEQYGLIVLDVKYVNLNNIKESNLQTVTKTDGHKMKNFHQIVKHYAFSVNNQLVKEFKDNSEIVHPSNSKMSGKLTFSYSSGLLLFVNEPQRYTKSDVAKILSLNENDFIIVNKMKNQKQELEQFIKNLNRPFVKGLTYNMQNEILKKIDINSDASSVEFIKSMGDFQEEFDKNFEDKLMGSVFEKSKKFKKNLIEYARIAEKSIISADKNLGLGCANLLEKLKGYKENIENEKFTVAVFGHFSVGKSTFLNLLMGVSSLPMGEDRTTSSLTKLKYCYSSNYSDGDMEVIYKNEIDISNLYKESINELFIDDPQQREEYLQFEKLDTFKKSLKLSIDNKKLKDFPYDKRDQKKNAKKILNFIIDNNIAYGTRERVPKGNIHEFLAGDTKSLAIDEVIYYLNNELLKDIEIVDTPGIGSENTMDTYKTELFLKEANAIIFLTEAKKPMSEISEIDFLRKYQKLNEDNNVDTLFILANKVDDSQKSVTEIKESIKNKINDNFDDELVLKDNKIFTISSKYHYDKKFLQKSKINTEDNKNISEDDLNNFINVYSKFLTKDKDKSLMESSVTNIDNTIKKLRENFDYINKKNNEDINKIKAKKEKFEKDKNEISETYNFYSQQISNIESKLMSELRDKLDSQKFSQDKEAIKQITEAYINYLEDKNKKSKDADQESSEAFYKELVLSIYKDVFEKNRISFTNKLDENMEKINKQIKKFSIELEEEYGISGLDRQISSEVELEDIEFDMKFEKGIKNSILDIIFFGNYVQAETYAEKMVDYWKDKTYSILSYNITNYNNLIINKILKEFEDQNKSIVDSISNKLDALEHNLTIKQKSGDEYKSKVEKMKSIFDKLNKFRDYIEKQKNDLYGELK